MSFSEDTSFSEGPMQPDRSLGVNAMHAPLAREPVEPQDGREPVPMVWIMAIIGLAMWSGWYLGSYTSGFSAMVYDGGPASVVQGDSPMTDLPLDLMATGKRVYNNCMACHQADGQGVAGQFPPLVGSHWVIGDVGVLTRILLQGLHGPIDVGGVTYNGVMPAWARLSDEQIAGVLTYVRKSWGNAADEIAPDVVAQAREETATRSQSWTASDLAALKATP